MALFVNPHGRYVEIDKNIEYWQQQEGFRLATEEEAHEQQQKRLQELAKMGDEHSYKDTIYFSSVSDRGGGDGYGMSSKNLKEAMEDNSITLSEYYVDQDIGLLYHSPVAITQLETPYKILYTMFESDKIPDDWKDYLSAADKILVPSTWCKKIFEKSGVECEVVPLGYNDKAFKPVSRQTNRKVYTFLHYDGFNVRKGHFEVIEAFARAFKEDEPVRLIIKTVRERVGIPINKSAYPNVEVVYGKLPEDELVGLLKESDCFVFPSRGEGFGLTPLEAMATGIPAIVPNQHGISEYFDKQYMYEVKATEKCEAIYKRLTDVGYMRKCDVDDLAKQMRYVFEHQEEAREKGKKAAKYVKKFTIFETAKKLAKIIDEIKSKPIERRVLDDFIKLEKV